MFLYSDDYAIICINMHTDASIIIRHLMTEKGLTQAQLAKLADISQSAVSRLLHGGGHERYGRARIKLFKYARTEESSLGDLTDPGPKRVANAFCRIWDGTEDHTLAIVRIISALAGLRPNSTSVKRGVRARQRKPPKETSKKHRS